MAYFLQQLINGLTLGSIYGLIAIGYTMVYGIIGMINFAHGEIYMIGAFVAVTEFLLLGLAGMTLCRWRSLVVLLVAMLFTALYGWAVERIAYRPLRGSFRLAPLISAIGMSIFLQNYVQVTQGARLKPMPPLVPGGFTVFESGGFAVQLSYLQLLIMLLTLVLMVGFSALIAAIAARPRAARLRAGHRMASLLGVDVDRMISLTFVMGAALAAVAGLMVTLYYGVIDFFIGFLAGVKAFTAAVLGGIGSLPGAMLGGLLIGLIEAFWSGYFSVEYKDVSVFAILSWCWSSCRPACSAGPRSKRSDGGCPRAAAAPRAGLPARRRSNGPSLLKDAVARGVDRGSAGAAVCRARNLRHRRRRARRAHAISTVWRSLMAAVFAGRFAVQLVYRTASTPACRAAGRARWSRVAAWGSRHALRDHADRRRLRDRAAVPAVLVALSGRSRRRRC